MEVVKQEGIKDCGVSCLLSVIRNYNGNISIEKLREMTNTTKQGVTAYNLVKTAILLGFNSYGLNDKLENLKDEDLPIISHIVINKNIKHFIVIYKIDRKKKTLIVMDPAKGKRKISFSEFNLLTSNNYIYLKPLKNINNYKDEKFIYKWIKDYLKHENLLILIILSLIDFILTLTLATLFKAFINLVSNYNLLNNINNLIIFFILIILLKSFTKILNSIYVLKLITNLNEYLTKKLFNRLSLLPYIYYKNRTSGEIVSKIKDLETIKAFFIKVIENLPEDLIIIIFFEILLFNKNKKLSIYLLVLSIILFIKEYLINKIIKAKKRDIMLEEDKTNSIIYENVRSMQTIKSMHIEKEKNNYLINNYKNLLSKAYSLQRLNIINIEFTSIINSLFRLLLIVIGIKLVIINKINLSSLILYEAFYSYYIGSINDLYNIYKMYIEYKVSKKRVEALFEVDIENFNCLEYFKEYNLNGNILIKDLTYQYGLNKVLNNINLKINKKDKIFLTGNSGVGKSTLMKILSGFITINYGYIKVNNIDITHIHLDIIRRKITYTSQNESLFTGSIKDNIVFENYNNDKLNKVIKIVGLEKIYKSSLGINEMIEENGANLSGGERQRIILARVLMKDSNIYIFDEALNEIDIEEENKILTEIIKYLEKNIVIVISHRLNTINLFNRILIMKDGKINEKL